MPHLDLFGFNPGKIEKIQKICLTSVTEFSLLRKKKSSVISVCGV